MDSTHLSNDDLKELREIAKSVHSFYCYGTDVFGVKTAAVVFGFSEEYIRGSMKDLENRVKGLKEQAYRWNEYVVTLIRME